MVISAVVDQIRLTIESSELTLMPYLDSNQPRFDPRAIPARKRYLARRIKLLNNIVMWRRYSGDHFDIGGLIVRLVTKNIRPVASSGWEVGGEDVMAKVRSRLSCCDNDLPCTSGFQSTPTSL